MFRQLVTDIFDLGFYPVPSSTRERLPLGRKSLTFAQMAWDVTCWILLALGIFLRQGLQLQNLTWRVERLTVGSFAASLVISFALFPMLMRRLNRWQPRPGLLQAATPFAFGFFLNLATVSAYKWFRPNS
jgi:hypothetical protein